MTEEETPARGERKAIDRRRSWILVTSAIALAVLVSAPFFGAPPSAVVVLAVIILIPVKKAAVNYIALGKRKAKLLQTFGSANQ